MSLIQFCAVFITCCLFPGIAAKVEFTNIECQVVDKSFCHFEYCFLKAVNRTYKYLSARAKFHSDDLVRNISFGIAILKRANGYKPFLYNVTVDACRYLKFRSNPLIRYFHRYFEAYSNINHTCPYKDYIAVDKLPSVHINYLTSDVLPMPDGEYMIFTSWYTYNIKRVIVKLYIRITN